MPQRLSESYRAGDPVEIYLEREDGGAWHPAKVLGFQHPGMWVQAAEGNIWFVTNTKRCRLAQAQVKE